MTDIENASSSNVEMEIPFHFVGHNVRIKLANKLDPLNNISGNDWRLLAEKLRYASDEIAVIDSQRCNEGRNTLKLFNDYIKKSGNSVQKVLKALKEMKRDDAFKILYDALPDVRQMMLERNAQEVNGPEENSFLQFAECPSMHVYKGNACCSLHSPASGYIHPWPFMHPLPPPYIMSPTPCAEHSVPSNSPPHTKHPRMCHGSPTLQCCGSSIYNHSISQNGFFLPSPSPTYNANTVMRPKFSDSPTEENDSVIAHGLRYNHGNMSMTNHDSMNDNCLRENPASLARTIFKNQGHNMLSFENSLTLPSQNTRSQSVEYNGDVSGSDDSLSSDSNPLSPNNNTKRNNNVTNDVTHNLSKQMSHAQKYDNVFVKNKMRESSKEKLTPNNSSISSYSPENNISGVPHRMKSLSAGLRVYSNGSEGVDNIENMMKKSLSLPSNMKPAEYKKVYDTKVFVTYSNDNKQHMKHVLSLCHCLEKNGFFCCVDVSIKNKEENRTQNSQTKNLEFFRNKFMEADFIVVCSSGQYRKDVSDKHSDVTLDSLHTKYIYQWMREEMFRNNDVNRRFVPVILEGTSINDIPTWLSQKTVKYVWPSQYKDLLWMLTKPEERVNRQTHRRD